MDVAIRETMARGSSFAEQLSWAAKAGVDGIELSGPALGLPLPELAAMVADSPVRVANVAGSPDLLHPDREARSKALDVMRERIERAALLDAVGVLTVPQFGRAPSLPDLHPYCSASDLETELLVAQLAELAERADSAGVKILLEPLNRYEAHLLNRIDQGVAIAERIGPTIGVLADFFHMNIEEADIAHSIRQAGRHVAYVHVADSNRLQPGRGHLDFRPGFTSLHEIGYDGYVGMEFRIDGPPDDVIVESVRKLKGFWFEAGH